MSKNIETRIEQLEDCMNYSNPPYAIVYIEGSKTLEEEKAEFKKHRGFDFPENDMIFKIVPYDGRRKPQQSTS